MTFYLDGMKDSKLDGPNGLAAATLRSLHAECAKADELEALAEKLRARAEQAEARIKALTEALTGLICWRGRSDQWIPTLDGLDRFAKEYGEEIPDESERTMHPTAGALRRARQALREHGWGKEGEA